MVVGPYLQYDISDGVTGDFYLLRYADDGRLLSPQTERTLKGKLAGISDVFLFSHGWNNTFADAAKRYRDFIHGFMKETAELGIPIRAGYKPLLIGVIWPSTSFLMPWEDGRNSPLTHVPRGLGPRRCSVCSRHRLTMAPMPSWSNSSMATPRLPRHPPVRLPIMLDGLRGDHDPTMDPRRQL